MPDDPRFGGASTSMAVVLPHTKTGPNQSVPLFDQDVADVFCVWMHTVHARSPAHALVFTFTPARFRQLMYNACVVHGVHSTPYVPDSLRHGGATADFLRTDFPSSMCNSEGAGNRWSRLAAISKRRVLCWRLSRCLQPLNDLGELTG